jgi:hypothetical protein
VFRTWRRFYRDWRLAKPQDIGRNLGRAISLPRVVDFNWPNDCFQLFERLSSFSRRNYLGAQYRRLASERRGRQRAAIAVSHSIRACLAYYIRRDDVISRDLGADGGVRAIAYSSFCWKPEQRTDGTTGAPYSTNSSAQPPN